MYTFSACAENRPEIGWAGLENDRSRSSLDGKINFNCVERCVSSFQDIIQVVFMEFLRSSSVGANAGWYGLVYRRTVLHLSPAPCTTVSGAWWFLRAVATTRHYQWLKLQSTMIKHSDATIDATSPLLHTHKHTFDGPCHLFYIGRNSQDICGWQCMHCSMFSLLLQRRPPQKKTLYIIMCQKRG